MPERMIALKNTAVGAVIVALLSVQAASAAEGGFSFYLPGTLGDIALAQTPEPGLQVANTVFYQRGDAGTAVLQGRVNLGLDFMMALDIVSATYTFEGDVLGGA